MMPTGDPIDRAIVFLRGVRALLLEPRAVARVLDRVLCVALAEMHAAEEAR